MKIASNTPSSFYSRALHDFVQLGEVFDGVSVILLMLEKNWGSNSIKNIEALSHWLSLYPKEIPCYIIGCESTIPDFDLERYQHKERDAAIRTLCDEVLKRSVSIGVRGEITQKYLTKMLGYDESRIDMIYDSSAKDNFERLDNFLKKNGLPIDLAKNILSFQKQPNVIYEKAIASKESITIAKPYVVLKGDVARLCADVEIDDSIKTVWCEASNIYRDFFLVERADAFLCVVLPLAMRIGKDIICEAPITTQFLHNINEILIPHLCNHDSRLHKVSIVAECDGSTLVCGDAVATGLSCGVDSFYTVSLYKNSQYDSMNLTHLYCGNYLYGNSGGLFERVERASEYLGMPLIKTATNINEVFNVPHLFVHFFKVMFGVLALRKMFRIYYYSSAEDFSHFTLKNNSIRDTAEIELLLLYVFSCSDFQVVSGGVKSERLEKTRVISSFVAAQRFLNVCLYPNQPINCGRCAKCMRTLLMLEMLGSLNLFSEVFDISEYYRNRLESFVYLVSQKDSVMLSDVYQYFLRNYPILIRRAEQYLSQQGG